MSGLMSRFRGSNNWLYMHIDKFFFIGASAHRILGGLQRQASVKYYRRTTASKFVLVGLLAMALHETFSHIPIPSILLVIQSGLCL